MAAVVNCKCQKPAIELTVKKRGPNTGRKFFACDNPQDQQCGFFEWASEAAPRVAAPPTEKTQMNTSLLLGAIATIKDSQKRIEENQKRILEKLGDGPDEPDAKRGRFADAQPQWGGYE